LQRLETYAAPQQLFRITCPQIDGGAVVVKPTKYFRKEAVKAEMAAGRTNDPEISTEMLATASAYRSQADALRKNKKADKKHRAKTSHDR
jgi:hypothetical protein